MADAKLDDEDENAEEKALAATNGNEDEDGEEGEDGEDGEGAAKAKKKKKMIMIIAAAVVLLLVGGGAGLYFTGMLDSLLGKEVATEGDAHGGEHGESSEGGEHGAPAAEGEHGGEHGEGAGIPTGPAFLKIPDMVVNLSTDDGQPRFLRLSVQLELKNHADMRKVEAIMPRVIDQFQTYLRELRVTDLRGSAGIYRLQIELLSRVNAAAYPVVVKDVLFQEILIQ